MPVEETNQDQENRVDEDDAEERFVVPDGLLPGSALVQNERQQDVDDVGCDEVGCAAFGETVPPLFEVAIPVLQIRLKVVTVRIVDIATNQP